MTELKFQIQLTKSTTFSTDNEVVMVNFLMSSSTNLIIINLGVSSSVTPKNSPSLYPRP